MVSSIVIPFISVIVINGFLLFMPSLGVVSGLDLQIDLLVPMVCNIFLLFRVEQIFLSFFYHVRLHIPILYKQNLPT